MKLTKRKLKSFFYNKTTFMLIPHNEKGILSLHLTNLNLVIAGLIFVFIAVFGFVLSFKTQARMSDYDYYSQENNYYQKQIQNIHQFLPNITRSQNTLFGKVDEVFGVLGVENKSLPGEKAPRMTTVSDLESMDDKIENISNYIRNFRNLFSQIPSIFPLVTRKYWFTSPFGWRRHPISGRQEMHPGMDIAAFPGTPIQASADGYVKLSGWAGGYGNCVVLNHDRGYSTRYAHMARTAVSHGSYVKKGQVIGYVGTTGLSTGYHLHFEVKLNEELLNPATFINLDRFGR